MLIQFKSRIEKLDFRWILFCFISIYFVFRNDTGCFLDSSKRAGFLSVQKNRGSAETTA